MAEQSTGTEILTLSFGTHHLVFIEREGKLFTELRLVKTGGSQTLNELPVPEGITQALIASTWTAQGHTYVVLHAPEWPYYIAGRALLHFPASGKTLLWNLTHYKDEPFDTWGWVTMSPEKFAAIRKMGADA